MLENIAPVAPEATLLALERSITNANDEEAHRYGTHYIQLLVHSPRRLAFLIAAPRYWCASRWLTMKRKIVHGGDVISFV